MESFRRIAQLLDVLGGRHTALYPLRRLRHDAVLKLSISSSTGDWLSTWLSTLT
jgi:hypothetical protein